MRHIGTMRCHTLSTKCEMPKLEGGTLVCAVRSPARLVRAGDAAGRVASAQRKKTGAVQALSSFVLDQSVWPIS